ncbi:hypothetical protein OSB04_021691, partial [Centaurea solstitialis]
MRFKKLLTCLSHMAAWNPLVERFCSKLSGWKAKTLSFGGWYTLCKLVLGSLGVYFFSLFEALSIMLKRLESLRRDFIWGSRNRDTKIPWVVWEKSLSSKEKGGLGIGSLKAHNAKNYGLISSRKQQLYLGRLKVYVILLLIYRPSAAVHVIPPVQAATSAPHQLHHHLTITLPFHPQPYNTTTTTTTTTTSLLLHHSPILLCILKFISPPEFLNDEDILTDFLPEKEKPTTNNNKGFSTGFYGFGSHLSSPVEFVMGSTEIESDEEDYLTGLTRKLCNNTLSRRFMEIIFQFQ